MESQGAEQSNPIQGSRVLATMPPVCLLLFNRVASIGEVQLNYDGRLLLGLVTGKPDVVEWSYED